MTRTRRAAAGLTVAVLVMATVISGCGNGGRAGDVVTSAAQTSSGVPVNPIEAPDPSLANIPAVAEVKPSVVKIHGEAPGCQKILEGSGFVIAPHRVMTNAHAVAGAESVSVEVDDKSYDAQVVSYDPENDIAVLDVPGLGAPWLTFIESPVKTGTDALILGYPNGGSFVATPARIREVIRLSGPDIYRTTTVAREVYSIRGTITAGVSGGPLIDLDGRVLGVAFGSAADDPETGFALTARAVAPHIANIANTAPVATGNCVN